MSLTVNFPWPSAVSRVLWPHDWTCSWMSLKWNRSVATTSNGTLSVAFSRDFLDLQNPAWLPLDMWRLKSILIKMECNEKFHSLVTLATPQGLRSRMWLLAAMCDRDSAESERGHHPRNSHWAVLSEGSGWEDLSRHTQVNFQSKRGVSTTEQMLRFLSV